MNQADMTLREFLSHESVQAFMWPIGLGLSSFAVIAITIFATA